MKEVEHCISILPRQDALARAWEKRRLWQAGTDLRAWLFTIMHNVYVNQLAVTRREAGNG